MSIVFRKDLQYYKFCLYGFFKNLRFFEAFLILFFLEKGLSFFEIGTLYAIREITIYILEIPTGIIADALGRRKMMLTAFVFYIISFLIFYFSATYGIFVLAMIAFSFGDALRSGNHKAMIVEYLSFKGWLKDRVHYYGNTRSWSQMGSALSSLVGGLIVYFTGSFRDIFLVSVIPYVLDFLLVASYPKLLDGDVRKIELKTIFKEFVLVFTQYRLALSRNAVIRAIMNLSIYSGYYRAVRDYLQPVIKTFAVSLPFFLSMTDKQRSSIMVGIVFFAIYILNSISSRLSGRISEQFRNIYIPLNITLFLGVFAGILSGVFYGISSYLPAILLFMLIYITENIRKPMGVAYISEVAEKKIMASAMSTHSLLQSILAAIIAPLIGIFADRFGIGNGLVIVSVMIAVVFPFFLARTNK